MTSDEQMARELVARYDQHCAAIRKLDPAWLRGEIAALLARRALEEAKWWAGIDLPKRPHAPAGLMEDERERIAALEQAASKEGK